MRLNRATGRAGFTLAVVALLAGTAASAAESTLATAAPMSSSAERIYAASRPSLLQIRTLVAATEQQSSIGSGFVVNAAGLAVTNYHVVAQFAFEPESYRLEYLGADGARGGLELMAIDVANDLAAVRVAKPGAGFFAFDDRALAGDLPKGERLYAMGNPHNLGFSIVEGTYNGLVERNYGDRIHFTGAINPGMSGGPAVTADGQVVGINVAKQVGSDLVSFLVPGRFAMAMLDRVKDAPLSPTEVRAEIGRQLARWQTGLYRSIGERGFRTTGFGPYEAPEMAAPWFTCWGQTNAGEVPKPRAAISTTQCRADTRIFIANDLTTGLISVSHSYLRSVDLNAFQFAALLSQQTPFMPGPRSRKWHTEQRCREEFLEGESGERRPALRAIWCARAYREFPGIYDVWVTTETQDNAREALVSRLTLQGTTYESAVEQARRFIAAIRWRK